MSADTRLDERLREAFAADDDWLPDVDLGSVRSAARRSTTRRATALAAAAALVVGGTAFALTRGDSEGVGPVAPPTSTPSAAVEAPSIEGEWTSGPVTMGPLRAALEVAGLEQYADAVADELRPGQHTLLLLHVDGGFVDLKVQRGRAKPDYVDRQSYELDGSRIVLSPREGTGLSVFPWQVLEGELSFQFESTTEPDVDGVPAEAYLRAFYTAVPFAPAG